MVFEGDTFKIGFLSTPSVWRVTGVVMERLEALYISIHTLRVEGDPLSHVVVDILPISIHTLRVEGDVKFWRMPPPGLISIHTLRVEGDITSISSGGVQVISIHTLRVEGDLSVGGLVHCITEFLSTPSVWRVTHSRSRP